MRVLWTTIIKWVFHHFIIAISNSNHSNHRHEISRAGDRIRLSSLWVTLGWASITGFPQRKWRAQCAKKNCDSLLVYLSDVQICSEPLSIAFLYTWWNMVNLMVNYAYPLVICYIADIAIENCPVEILDFFPAIKWWCSSVEIIPLNFHSFQQVNHVNYPLVVTNSWPWKITMLLIGKPSISIRAIASNMYLKLTEKFKFFVAQIP